MIFSLQVLHATNNNNIIYSIIFVTQLKSINIFENLYQRSKSDYLSSINTKNQKKEKNSRYEIEKIVEKRFKIFD